MYFAMNTATTPEDYVEKFKALSPAKRAFLMRALREEGGFQRNSRMLARRSEPSAPLSFAQKRLFFIDQMYPGNPAYNLPTAVRMRGALDVAILKQSLDDVIRHHESLRTTFEIVNNEPIQIIGGSLDLPVPVIDLTIIEESEREAQAHRLAIEEGKRPFDLAQGPLLRLTLIKMGEQDHVALVTMHHIISDAWSMGLFVREIAAAYEAFSAGLVSPLSEPKLQYADFAVWQQEWLESEAFAEQLSYWKNRLSGATAVRELPTDHPRPPVQTFDGAKQYLSLPNDLAVPLEALSRAEGVTVFMTLLAVFTELLHLYTQQEDILIGSPVDNRNRVELESIIGFFVSTQVLRTDLSGDPTFRELMSQVREVVLGAHAHQELPFEMLVREMNLDRNLGIMPLFQVWFVFQIAPPQATEVAGLTFSSFDVDYEMARYDLKLDLLQTSEGISGSFEYNRTIFDSSTVQRIARQFQSLLTLVIAQPDLRLSELQRRVAESDEQQRIAERIERNRSNRTNLKLARRKAVVQSL